jgi:AraC family transcriptional regulator of adaptative response/methylated-DNA-[protein]-cysteine methyltransferase
MNIESLPSKSREVGRQQLTDYEWAKYAIAAIVARRGDQPEIAEIAAQLGVSPARFSRAFKRWCGLSPKQFLEVLTLADAKKHLLQSKSVLDASLAAGLSGPSRLHDLFVQVDGLSPGEFSGTGDNPEIRYGLGGSPFGQCLIGRTRRGICHLQFVDGVYDDALAQLARTWPDSALVRDDGDAQDWVQSVFDSRRPWDEGLHLRGTNFQVKVWEALLAIPAGSVAPYAWVADAIKQPGAARAVGTATGANQVAYLIPCHRVLRSNGGLGGYRWGTSRKQAMLAWERCAAARH